MIGKNELRNWMYSMIPIDDSFLSQSSAAYLPDIQNLEATLRPLWGIFPDFITNSDSDEVAKRYVRQLKQIVDNDQLPKITTKNRQIAVELGVVAYMLGNFQNKFLTLFSKNSQKRLVDWLNEINTIDFPEGNWYFFLILVNSALKRNHLDYSQEKLNLGLAKINSYYIGNGWYTDGPGKQMDYYVAFAFHFYGIMYSRWFDDRNAQEFQRRAVVFADQFQYWFDESGRSLPFGRSLTYRFAHVSFWSALVVSGLYKRTSLSLGQIKGIIERNFKFWQKQAITLPHENNLSIGYGYGQQLMSEDYNAPGSPMWAFKSFILFELPVDDEFWKIEIEPLNKQRQVVQKEAGFLINSSNEQTTALSVSQFPKNPNLYCGSEKYCKFAYSTAFGFNVSRKQSGLNNLALDSTLMFSIPGHEQFVPRKKIDESFVNGTYGISVWHLWDDVFVRTYLIPIDAQSHIRIHEIKNNLPLDVAEGSFPLADWNHKYNLSENKDNSVEVFSLRGMSGIQDLTGDRDGVISQQGPNTNIYSPNPNAIPILRTTLDSGEHVLATLAYGFTNSDEQSPHVKFDFDDENFKLKIEGKNLQIPRM
jgi:hypothetical protein